MLNKSGYLEELRNVIKEQVPEALEKISYQMPAFFLNGNLVYFAGYSKCIVSGYAIHHLKNGRKYELFEETCNKYPFVVDLAQRKFEIEGYDFVGMNWVVDYPFRLKDRCRMDTQP